MAEKNIGAAYWEGVKENQMAEQSKAKPWEFDFWGGALPEQCGADDVDVLIEVITDRVLQDPMIGDALDRCDLQPTTRAARLAAHAAVIVLLAHERGQQVARDVEADEAEAPAA